MKEVKLIGMMPNEVMDIVKELRKNGYAQGIDFDFEYHKPRFDDMGFQEVYNRFTIFKFYREELATWFVLRYQ